MQQQTKRHAFHKAALALAATSALASSVANAQTGVLVQDVKSEVEQHAQTAKQIEQYIKQGQQYMTQLQQYEQMFTKVMNLGTNFSIMPNTMQEIDAGPLIAANCNSGQISIVGSLLNQVTSLMNQSTAQSQQAICAQIVTTQVHEYNITVDMVNQIQSNIPALQKLSSLTSTFSTPGESSSATTQAAGIANDMAAAMNTWKTNKEADDAILQSLQGMQSTLAQGAMRGNPSLMGDAVQAAALTAAFSIDQ